MNKTQLNRTNIALNREARSKITAFNDSAKQPKIKDAMLAAAGWAKKNTKAFTEESIRKMNISSYVDVSEILRETDAYRTAKNANEQARLEVSKKLAAYESAINEEVDRIMDELYLGESTDALKAIDSFKKFKI